MTYNLIALFFVIPISASIVSALLIRRFFLQRLLGVASIFSMLIISLILLIEIKDGDILVSQVGGWPAPFGITLVFDSLSGLLICAGLVVALGCYIHGFSSLSLKTERRYFHPLIQLLLVGVNQCFLTGDLFNLFVGFEIMLMVVIGVALGMITRLGEELG